MNTPDQDHETFDAFISYAQADGTKVAEQLNKDLTHFGRKPWKLRTFKIFRDTHDLSAKPDLRSELHDKLDKARFLIVVASPEARSSPWVNDEIDYWFSTKKNPLESIILCLAKGKAPGVESDNLPPALHSRLERPEDHFFVDFREPKDGALSKPERLQKVAQIAAALTDTSVRQILRREHKRRNRTMAALAVVAIVTTLSTIAATLFFIRAQEQSDLARDQADNAAAIAYASRSTALAETQPLAALALAVEAVAVTEQPTTEALQALTAARSAVQQRDERQIGPFFDQNSSTWDVSFHPDGLSFATVSLSGKVTVRDATTGAVETEWVADTQTGRFIGHANVRHSSDGVHLAAHFPDGNLYVWNLDTSELVVDGAGDGNIGSAEFSPDGKTLLSVDWQNGFQRWDTATWEPVGSPVGDEITQLSYSPDGSFVATSSEDAVVELWDTSTWEPLGEPITDVLPTSEESLATGFVQDIQVSPDSRTIAVLLDDWGIKLYDSETGSPKLSLPGTSDEPSSDAGVLAFPDLVFHPDSKSIASRNPDDPNTVIWRGVGAGSTPSAPLSGHRAAITGLAVSRDGKKMATSAADETLGLWKVENSVGKLPTITIARPGSEDVAVAYEDGTISFWDSTTGSTVASSLTGHPDSIQEMAFDPTGKTLVSYGDDQTLRFWDVASGESITVDLGNEIGEIPRALAFTLDGVLLSGHEDGSVRSWNVTTGTESNRFDLGDDQRIVDLAVHPEGTEVAIITGLVELDESRTIRITSSQENDIGLWNIQSGQPVGAPFKGHEDGSDSVRFSPDGERIATTGRDKTLRLWDVTSREQVGEPLSTDIETDAVCFCPDSSTISAASSVENSEQIKRWNVDDGSPLGEPLTFTTRVDAFTFSSSGQYLTTVGGNKFTGRVAFWNVATGSRVGNPDQAKLSEEESVLDMTVGEATVTTVSADGVKVWDRASGLLLNHTDLKLDSDLSTPGTSKLLVSRDGQAIVQHDGPSVQSFGLDGRPAGAAFTVFADPLAVHVSGDGNYVYAAERGDEAESINLGVWEIASGVQVGETVGFESSTISAGFSVDSSRVIVTDKTSVMVWPVDSLDGQDPELLYEDSVEIRNAELVPGNEHVIVERADRSLVYVEAATGTVVYEPVAHDAQIVDWVVHPDGRHVAFVDTAGLGVWDAHTGVRLGGPLTTNPDDDSWFGSELEYSTDGTAIGVLHDGKLTVWEDPLNIKAACQLLQPHQDFLDRSDLALPGRQLQGCTSS